MKKSLVFISLIITTTLLVWHKILNQALLEEGFFYFDKNQRLITSKTSQISLWSHDNFARLFFDILPSVFRDNIKAYLAAELVLLILIYVTLFLVISKISKDRIISLTATILFIANYIGSAEMLSPLSYQRFLQRVPNLIPALIAFYYLHKFLYFGKMRNYFASLALFALAVLMGHYTAFLLPLFIIYPLTTIFVQKINIGNVVKKLTISGIFFIITIYFINHSPIRMSTTPHDFFSDQKWLGKILYQVPTINVPGEIVSFLAEQSLPPVPYPYIEILKVLSIPIVAVYLGGGVLVYKKRKNFFPLYLTSFISAISIMALYVFIAPGLLDVFRDFGQNRAYFLSTLMNSIAWAILFKTVLTKKMIKLLPIILVIIVAYNIYHIYNYANTFLPKSKAMLHYLAYVKSLSGKLNQNTIIVTLPEFCPPQPFIELFYGKSGLKVFSIEGNWQKEVSNFPDFSEDNFYVLSYDSMQPTTGGKHPQRGVIIDLSDEYRKKLISLPK